MRLEQHIEYTELYGKIYTDTVIDIDPEDIVKWDQARVNGDNQKTYNRYLSQWLKGAPQNAPLSVVPLPGGKYLCKDGTTRGKSKKTANKKIPQTVKVSTFQHDVLNFSPDDWMDFQDKANDHPGGAPSTEADVESRMKERYLSGTYSSLFNKKTGRAYISSSSTDRQEFIEIAAEHAQKLNTNLDKDIRWFKNRIGDFIQQFDNANTGIKTYNDDEIVEDYKTLGGTPWQGKAPKSISNGEHIFILRRENMMNPNLFGSLVGHINEHAGVEYTIILSFADVLKTNPEQIPKMRDAVCDAVKRAIDPANGAIRLHGTRVTIKHTNQISSDKPGFTTIYDTRHLKIVKQKEQ